jgi:uncharacterized protein YbbK (DUF523 family)
MYLVSACLVGLNTRYNGVSCPKRYFRILITTGRAIPICPEQLGGLSTPREPIELQGGDGEALLKGRAKAIGKSSGRDYTQDLLKGAREVLKIAKMAKSREAFLKDGSPSCGCFYIDKKTKGRGVTTALLLQAGIKVHSEDKLPKMRR